MRNLIFALFFIGAFTTVIYLTILAGFNGEYVKAFGLTLSCFTIYIALSAFMFGSLPKSADEVLKKVLLPVFVLNVVGYMAWQYSNTTWPTSLRFNYLAMAIGVACLLTWFFPPYAFYARLVKRQLHRAKK